MEHMRAKGKVPLGVTEDGVKFAKSWVSPLVTPRETAVLEVDLIYLTSMKGVAEAGDATPVDTGFVFISSAMNLVEISKGKPADTRSRLLREQFRKEIIFSVGGSWSIYSCDAKITILIDHMDGCGEAKLGDHNVSYMDGGIIPKQQNSSSGSLCRSVSKPP